MLHLDRGRRYIRRNGTITPPLKSRGDNFFDPETSLFYSNEEFGNQVYGASGEDADDLISEAPSQ